MDVYLKYLAPLSVPKAKEPSSDELLREERKKRNAERPSIAQQRKLAADTEATKAQNEILQNKPLEEYLE